MATKGELAMLEKLFAAEIEGRILQSRSQMMLRLVAKGYAEPAQITFPSDRFGPIVVKGYALTHLGRLTYCATCEEPEPLPQNYPSATRPDGIVESVPIDKRGTFDGVNGSSSNAADGSPK